MMKIKKTLRRFPVEMALWPGLSLLCLALIPLLGPRKAESYFFSGILGVLAVSCWILWASLRCYLGKTGERARWGITGLALSFALGFVLLPKNTELYPALVSSLWAVALIGGMIAVARLLRGRPSLGFAVLGRAWLLVVPLTGLFVVAVLEDALEPPAMLFWALGYTHSVVGFALLWLGAVTVFLSGVDRALDGDAPEPELRHWLGGGAGFIWLLLVSGVVVFDPWRPFGVLAALIAPPALYVVLERWMLKGRKKSEKR